MSRSTSLPVRLLAVILSMAVLLVTIALPALAKSPTVIVAGDIAAGTGTSGEAATARLVEGQRGLVMTAGDNAYQSGTREEFQAYYDPTWGRLLHRTRPTPGNHDVLTPGASGYFDYFGRRAGPDRRGYYGVKVGSWRAYALDSEACKTEVGCGPGSPQYTWLKKKLAKQRARCSMAVWHTPLYSSGSHGDDPRVRPLQRLLWKSGVEIIVNGHDHNYERLAPADPYGRVDRRHGVQQFIVGTGGAPLRGRGDTKAAHSRAFQGHAWGVLRLRLRNGSYAWKFLPVEGETYSDGGERRCHGRP